MRREQHSYVRMSRDEVALPHHAPLLLLSILLSSRWGGLVVPHLLL
jgi:hypothetical protein